MRKLGRYLLLERLGAGSFATVWKAYDPELDTEVAVKVLADNWAANADVRERFLAEARLLRRIASPRVVRVHDVGVQEDRPYFVMDYVRGGTLADRVGQCDPQEALRLAAEAGYAVQVLHEAGVVHRDVKPSNLLLAAGPAPAAVLVADLGSAKQLADASGLTVTTGTPAYMAPEQAFQTGGFDGRADVYALAVVAYELLTGQKPFGTGGRATALMTDQPTASTLPALPAGTELPRTSPCCYGPRCPSSRRTGRRLPRPSRTRCWLRCRRPGPWRAAGRRPCARSVWRRARCSRRRPC